MKTKTFLFMILTSLVTALYAAPAVKDFPAIKPGMRPVGGNAMQKLYILSIIYPQMPHSVKSGDILNLVQKQYSADKVEVFAVLPAAKEKVSAFAAMHPEFDIALCSDVDLKLFRKLLGSNVNSFGQSSIFNAAGKLLWNGEIVDLPMMTRHITSGKYSEREEIQFSALQNSLKAALRSGNAKLIAEAADQILLRRPEQISAVNAKAYALEISNDIEGIKKFFQSRIDRFPTAQENYFMYIDAAFRIVPLQNQAPGIVRQFINAFPKCGNDINALVWDLLIRLPFDHEAYKTACYAEKILLNAPGAVPSRALATLALLEYRRCNLVKAQKLLAQAQALAKTAAEKDFLEKLAAYFNTVAKQ